MCGIIGYVGHRASKPLLLQGLKRLEYRGYDSAGIALLEDDGLDYTRAVGPLDNLVAAVGPNGSVSTTGLGHTRWATHGGVTEANAHPLTACDERKLAIVMNGIVENYRELREELARGGPHVHLRDGRRDDRAPARGRVPTATSSPQFARCSRSSRATSRSFSSITTIRTSWSAYVTRRRWSSASATARTSSPRTSQRSSPRRAACSSRTTARSSRSRPTASRSSTSATGEIVEHDIVEIDWDDDAAERSGYETFMLKEIYEQPEGVAETIGDRVRHGHLVLEGLGMTEEELKHLRRIVIVACGTSYHAGVVGRYAIEEWARVPVEPDVASEWIYRNPVIDPGTLVIGISQSGETRDTIQAMKLAREHGARTVAITNMMGSQITREVDSVLYTRTGLEVGVAASKTFTAQAALLFLIGLKLAQCREHAAGAGDRVHPRRGLRPAGEDAAVPRRRPPDRGDRPALP